MRNSPLFKYKIGLGAVGLFVFVLLIMVLVQGGSVKHDNEIYKKADKISTKLNDYTDSKNKVPVSLDQVGVSDVPEDISYTRLSSTRYKFCMTYKKTGNNYGADYLATNLYTGGHADDYYGNYTPSEDDGYLYISPTHKKGENCQTVKIYSYDYYDDYYKDDGSDTQSL
jgi:hypothetical protein